MGHRQPPQSPSFKMATPTLPVFLQLILITFGPLRVGSSPSEEAVVGEIKDYLTLHVGESFRKCDILHSNITRVVRYRDSNVYNLNTTFVWDDEGTPGLSYEVGLVRKNRLLLDASLYTGCFPTQCGSITHDEGLGRCMFVQQWYNTSTNEITIPAPYSYKYSLYIHPWNSDTGVFMPGNFFIDFPYEDCLEFTSDKTFCSTQDIELATPVVNLMGRLSQEMVLNVSWQEPIQLNTSNLCAFLVNVNGYAVSRVNWTKPRDPERVYSVEINVRDRRSTTSTSFEVKVLNSHCRNNYLGIHSASILVNYSSVVEVPDPNSTATVEEGVSTMTSPQRTTIFFVLVVVTAVMLVCVITLIAKWCIPQSPDTIRFDDENDAKAILPIFAEKELNDPSSVKYDVTSPVGTGQYGNVYKGEVYLKDCEEWRTAAVKVAKEHDLVWKEDFLDEIKLLLELGSHPNIVEVLGCCTASNPPLLITEFMRYGDLLHFLHKCRVAESVSEDVIYSITEADLVYIALQVAQGMKYISSSKFYHGDLSARNVLIGEGLVTKISDFGLANDLYETGYKRMAPGRKRPLRWVSLETLKTGYCSHQSDVWSYGVLLFEVFSLGATPYHDIPLHEISESLQRGYRLPRPAVCPQEVYNTMRECWKESPEARPTFAELAELFECLHQREDPSATSGSSFISNPELRSVVFQPFFEEDEEPSLLVSASVDTGSILGSDSGVDSVRVTDAGSLADSESVGAPSSVGAFDRQISTGTGDMELGMLNHGFVGEDAVSGSDTLIHSHADAEGDEGNSHERTNIRKSMQRQDSGCPNDLGFAKDELALST